MLAKTTPMILKAKNMKYVYAVQFKDEAEKQNTMRLMSEFMVKKKKKKDKITTSMMSRALGQKDFLPRGKNARALSKLCHTAQKNIFLQKLLATLS